MPRIDAHQHFWKFDPVRDNWINEDMKCIQQDFLPTDLQPILDLHDFDGCIAVQSSESALENQFHLELADHYDFIKGIVGWIDFDDVQLAEKLAYYAGFNKMKGFRHILQGQANRASMLDTNFKAGIKALGKHGFTYDLLILPDQLEYATELVAAFPDQQFVIDHLAKPPIKKGEIAAWAKQIANIGKYENVHCKISGMVTEAH